MGDTEPTESERTIGFLPSYLPDSVDAEPNSPSQGIISPPYQHDLLSYDQDPPPYSPDLSRSKHKASTYDPDAKPPPYPSESADEDGTKFLSSKQFHLTIPSAPSIDEIEYRTGLTEVERQEILNSLSKMRAHVLWKSQEEKKDFSQAEDEVIEFLHAVESRLTNSEKEEFLIELRKINQMRDEEGIREHEFATKWCRESITIGLKIFEMAMSIVIFVNVTEPKRSLDRRMILLFFESVGILSTCFLISYLCYSNRARNVHLFDNIFCIISTTGCAIAGYFSSDNKIGTYAFWAMITYGVDTFWKLCQKGIYGDQRRNYL